MSIPSSRKKQRKKGKSEAWEAGVRSGETVSGMEKSSLTVLDVAANQLILVHILLAAPLPVVVVVDLQGEP